MTNVPKYPLSKEQVHEIVAANYYKVDPEKKFLSRCIDGRYTNEPQPAALAIPGADPGDLAVLYAAANSYGFKLDYNKALNTLVDLVGGVENFSFYSDARDHVKDPVAGDGHFTQMRLDPEAYGLEKKQLDLLVEQILQLGKKGAKETTLHGNHHEGAVLMVRGDYGILPQFDLVSSEGTRHIQLFVYHYTLTNLRHRALAKKLIENEVVELFPSLDEEYLYEVLSITSDDHLFETVNRLAQGLPIYRVTFKEDGSFLIEDQGSA